MTAMSISKMAFVAAAAAAVFSVSTTEFSVGINPVTAQKREAYEAARFLTPEGKTASDSEMERLTYKGVPAADSPLVNDALLHSESWPELAQGKLYGYTATLMANAERDGTGVPEARTAADRILQDC